MTKQEDFVFESIYRGAIRQGAIEKIAKDHAIIGVDDFKKGKFKKALDLISEHVSAAKRESKNAGIKTR